MDSKLFLLISVAAPGTGALLEDQKCYLTKAPNNLNLSVTQEEILNPINYVA